MPSSYSVTSAPMALEVLDDQRDAVGLLDAEFLGVADADAVAGVGRDGGEDGQLVDELGGERAAMMSAPLRPPGATLTWMVPISLAVVLFDGEDAELGAEQGEDVEQRGAGGVHAERVEDEVGVGEEQRGAEEEGGRGDVAGNGGVDGVELLAAGDAEAVCRPCESALRRRP